MESRGSERTPLLSKLLLRGVTKNYIKSEFWRISRVTRSNSFKSCSPSLFCSNCINGVPEMSAASGLGPHYNINEKYIVPLTSGLGLREE